MATDDSPPRNKTIVIYGLVSVALLITLKLGLDWYFVRMTHAERARVHAIESAPGGSSPAAASTFPPGAHRRAVRAPAATDAHP